MAVNVSTGTIGAASPSAGTFPANHKFYMRQFLEVLGPELMYDKFGDMVAIDPNNSNTIVANKVAKLSTLESSPLTEGTTPSEQTFTLTRIEQSINQYGGFARTSDRLSEESVNGITTEFTTRIAEQGAETMNLVMRDDLLGSTNVRRSGAAATIDDIGPGDGPTVADFTYMWEAFKAEKVRPWAPMTKGSPNTGTQPIAEAFPMIVPVEARSLLEALDDTNGNAFENVYTYAGQIEVWPHEIGRFKEFRFIVDTEAEIANNSNGTPQKVARCLCFGKGVEGKAYKTTTIGNSNMELIIKPLGSSGTADPLNQRASVGWKAKKGAFVTQPTYMFRYEFSIGNV